MPIYEYQCQKCGHHIEVLQKISDSPLRKCPDCGRQSMKRLLSAVRFRLAGSGWYETDFKSDQERKRNLAGDGGEGASESKAEGNADAKADVKPDVKPDAKSEAPASGKSDGPDNGKSDAKTDTKSESKSELKSESKPDSSSRSRSTRSTPVKATKPAKSASTSRKPTPAASSRRKPTKR